LRRRATARGDQGVPGGVERQSPDGSCAIPAGLPPNIEQADLVSYGIFGPIDAEVALAA